MMYIDRDAKNYGDGLFMLTEELGETEQVKEDFELLCTAIQNNPEFLQLLDTPALSREERIEMIEKAFGKLSRNLVNLFKILSERRSAYLIHKIKDSYMMSYDVSRGIERVEAISIIPLTIEQINKLTVKLEDLTGKKIIVNNTIDPSILGGMKLRYLGQQIDSSIKTKLDKFDKSLKDLVI